MGDVVFRGFPENLTLQEVEALRKAEVFAAQRKWRALYARAVHEESGEWTYRGYDWHTFSYGYMPCLEGASAVAALRERLGESVLIFADAGNSQAVGGRATLRACGDVLRGRRDWILAAQDFSWTFALTHEAAFGPYFAEADDELGDLGA